jgi:hypothetical protein
VAGAEIGILDRNPTAPINDLKECLRGNDEDVASETPFLRPSEDVQRICYGQFVYNNQGQKSLIFSSETSLIGFENAKQEHSALGSLFLSRETLEKETLDIAGKATDTEALANCRNFALSKNLNPDSCKIRARFEPEFSTDDSGFWSRSLAVLE